MNTYTWDIIYGVWICSQCLYFQCELYEHFLKCNPYIITYDDRHVVYHSNLIILACTIDITISRMDFKHILILRY